MSEVSGGRLFGFGRNRRRSRSEAGDAQPPSQREAARLAAIAAGLGRVSHDLRGILAPALLSAERMEQHADPAVRRSAEVTLRAVERAMALLHDQVGALRADLPDVEQVSVKLQPAIDAAAPPGLALLHAVPEALDVLAHPDSLLQGLKAVLAALERRGAAQARLEIELVQRHVVLTCIHDGRAEPDSRAPAEASDPSWSIPRDFLRACGAELLTPPGPQIVTRLQRG